MFNKINILAILLVSFNLPTANASLDKEYSGATIRYYGTSYSAKLKDSSVKEEPATKIDNCSNGNLQITRAELDAMIANSEDVTGVCTSGIKDMSYLFAADNLTQTHLTTFNQDIIKNVILDPNAQIWKLGPRPLNLKILKENVI